jgi:outer membrane protein
MTSKILIGAAAVATLACASSALAQSRSRAAPAKPATTAAAPAAATGAAPTPINFGPPITGMCLFSEERAVATSKAGQAANTRMQQLRAQVQAELQPEGTALQNDVKTFQAQRATLTGDALAQKQAPLEARIQAFQAKDQQRQQELQATGEKALQRIRSELDAPVRAVLQARNCSVLLNADGAVFGGNPAMDITAAVVTQLDTKLPTLTFDREHLDAAAQGAAAAPAR